MRRYLQYEFRQSGVQVKDFTRAAGVISMSALPKVRGQIFHTLSHAIVEGAETRDWIEILNKAGVVLPENIRQQQLTLIRRAMMGWEIVRGPWWRQHFDVISAEQEWLWPLSTKIVEPLRLDKILRRKEDGLLGIMDYKTLSSVDPNWVQRLDLSDQTHLYVQALKERSAEYVLGICYDGVIIGKWKDGQQRSPFTLGFLKNGKVGPKWAAGSTNVDLTTYADEKWLEWVQGTGTLHTLYCTTDFLHPPSEILLQTKASVARAEEEFDDRVQLIESIRSTHGEDSPEFSHALHLLERNGNQCLKYGLDYACPFVQECWSGFKFDSDVFEPREDHHGEQEDE